MSPRILRSMWPALALMLLVVLATALTSVFASSSLEQIAMTTQVNVILVVGLYVYSGISGVISFGHVSFMTIGAYSFAILAIPSTLKQAILPALPVWLLNIQLDPVVATIAAGLMGALGALVLAAAMRRLSGLTAGLSTFAVLAAVRLVASNWNSVTRGEKGLSGVPQAIDLWSAVAWVIVVIAVVFAFQRSTVGMRLRASRDDEVAARSIGISVGFERSVSLILSGAVVGVGGALFAQEVGAFGPDYFYIGISFMLIAYLVFGGLRSLAGAVLGTIFLSIILELLRRVETGPTLLGVHFPNVVGLSELGLAIVLIITLLIRPRGLTNGREISWPFRSLGVSSGRSTIVARTPFGAKAAVRADAIGGPQMPMRILQDEPDLQDRSRLAEVDGWPGE